MRKAEIQRRFDEIVEFAEIERFIDTPVKRYSSGMYVRLAFAVAAHLEPEILIIDEVLAVGDVNFQRKCLGKMHEVATQGRTVLFVSHNMGAVAELCTRAILLSKGTEVAEGEVSSVLDAYSRLNATAANRTLDADQDPSLPVSILSLRAHRDDDSATGTFDLGESINVTVEYRVTQTISNLILAMTVSRNMIDLIHTFDLDEADDANLRTPGVYRARYRIPAMTLKAGIYSLSFSTTTPEIDFQHVDSGLSFEVEELSVNTYLKGYRRDRPGHLVSPGTWETTKVE
jgi:lipopolysaccharide transport system ATP-binding protein